MENQPAERDPSMTLSRYGRPTPPRRRFTEESNLGHGEFVDRPIIAGHCRLVGLEDFEREGQRADREIVQDPTTLSSANSVSITRSRSSAAKSK